MLTEVAIRNAKPEKKRTRLFDERGLYLEVSPAGGAGGVSNITSLAARIVSRWVSTPM